MENLSNPSNGEFGGKSSRLHEFLSPDNKNKIHLIGIGGSGMYPLAQILHGKGFTLTGSDNNPTDTIDAVRKMGITVFMGHNPDNIKNADVIVRSAAIKDDNPEITAARQAGIPVIERAELLGYITQQYSKAVCVSGTHGKTTVSSMLCYIFMAAEADKANEYSDISAVIGGKLKLFDNGSGRTGKNDIMVCEACEYADTFLNLQPNISVILNVNEDHLEYFKTMENLRLSFTKFCNLTSDTLVINADDENTVIAVKESNFSGKILTFGRDSACDYYPSNIKGNRFDLFKQGEFLVTITLKIPGEHNVLNAVAACAAADSLGCKPNWLVSGLESFPGAGRRFETLAVINGITVVDDYAHHPDEIAATLNAAKTLNYERIWAVHQPFTYSRTKSMLREFAEALSIADKVTLTEIMGGREVDNNEVSSADLEKLTSAKRDCNCFNTFEEVAEHVACNAGKGDLIITMGCGDVNKAAHLIIAKLKAYG